MGDFQVIDIIFVILTVLMIIHGFIRGFVTELFSWASLAIGILAAVFLHPPVAEFVRDNFMPGVNYLPEILSFIVIFIAGMVVCKLLEQIFRNVITGANLGGLDKILGAVFGFVEGVAIAGLIIFVLSVQPFFDVHGIIRESIFARFLLPHIYSLPLNIGREVFDTALDWMGKTGV